MDLREGSHKQRLKGILYLPSVVALDSRSSPRQTITAGAEPPKPGACCEFLAGAR